MFIDYSGDKLWIYPHGESPRQVEVFVAILGCSLLTYVEAVSSQTKEDFISIDTIHAVFPESTTQICVVHQIINSCKYVVYRDLKEFATNMKERYTSANKSQAESALAHFEQKWGSKYRHAVQSWHRNWDD